MPGDKPPRSSSSKAQHDLMAAVANNPKFARQTGIPAYVGKEFYMADKAAGKFPPKKPPGQ